MQPLPLPSGLRPLRAHPPEQNAPRACHRVQDPALGYRVASTGTATPCGHAGTLLGVAGSIADLLDGIGKVEVLEVAHPELLQVAAVVNHLLAE